MSVNKKIIETEAAAEGDFNVVTYTGNGSTQSITGVGFQPDFVWVKDRGDVNYSHYVTDSTRGTGKVIITNDTIAETTGTNRITSFDSGGFTVGNSAGFNNNGADYVAWCWKANGGVTSSNTDGSITSTVQANQDAGFSIVKYTGTGVNNATFGHGLSAAPEFVIFKTLDVIDNWRVVHKDLANANGYLILNSTGGEVTALGGDGSIVRDGISATTITCTAGSSTSNNTNKSGDNYIAYCFHSVAGYSKIGSYSGNGGSNSITGLGFQPDFVMIKSTGSGSWFIYDSVRSVSVGDNAGTANARPYILPSSSNKENGATSYNVNLDSNGFSMNTSTTDLNVNGTTYIYMAFKIN